MISIEEVHHLLGECKNHGLEITFHDILYPPNDNEGAYFTYSTEKVIVEKTWNMTYGNHIRLRIIRFSIKNVVYKILLSALCFVKNTR